MKFLVARGCCCILAFLGGDFPLPAPCFDPGVDFEDTPGGRPLGFPLGVPDGPPLDPGGLLLCFEEEDFRVWSALVTAEPTRFDSGVSSSSSEKWTTIASDLLPDFPDPLDDFIADFPGIIPDFPWLEPPPGLLLLDPMPDLPMDMPLLLDMLGPDLDDGRWWWVTGGAGGGFGLGGSGMYFGRTGFLVTTLVETLARVSGFLPCRKLMKESMKAD